MFSKRSSKDKPIFYYDPLSCQSRSCLMLMQLLNISADFRLTERMEDLNFSDTYTWINSFCALPTLIDGQVTLCDGRSILIYLNQKYGVPKSTNLCCSEYKARLKLNSLLLFEGCVIHRCLVRLLTDIFLANYPNFNMDYHLDKVSCIYAALNSYLNHHSFLVGNELTIADISIVSSVSALNLVFPIEAKQFPNLCKWFKQLQKMEFYCCNDEGLQNLHCLLHSMGKLPINCPSSSEREGNRMNKSIVHEKYTNGCNKTANHSPTSVEIECSSEEDEDERNKKRHSDTYYIALRKCSCWNCAARNNTANETQQKVSAEYSSGDINKRLTEISRRMSQISIDKHNVKCCCCVKDDKDMARSSLKENKKYIQMCNISTSSSESLEYSGSREKQTGTCRYSRCTILDKNNNCQCNNNNNNARGSKTFFIKERQKSGRDTDPAIASEEIQDLITNTRKMEKLIEKSSVLATHLDDEDIGVMLPKCPSFTANKEQKERDVRKRKDKQYNAFSTDQSIINQSSELLRNDVIINNLDQSLTHNEVQMLLDKVRKLEKVLAMPNNAGGKSKRVAKD